MIPKSLREELVIDFCDNRHCQMDFILHDEVHFQ